MWIGLDVEIPSSLPLPQRVKLRNMAPCPTLFDTLSYRSSHAILPFISRYTRSLYTLFFTLFTLFFHQGPPVDLSEFVVKDLEVGATHFSALFSRRWIDDEECGECMGCESGENG